MTKATTSAEPEFLLTADLMDRAWTRTLIKHFLDPPDRTSENPHHRSGPPIKRYDLRRVKKVESTAKFKKAASKAKRRSDAQKAVAVKTSNALLDAAEEMTITIEKMPLAKVMKDANESYNADARRERDFSSADMASPRSFLERNTVNYIRHKLTHYEQMLDDTSGKTGARDAKEMIVERILDAIAEAYPELADECARQRKRKLADLNYETYFG